MVTKGVPYVFVELRSTCAGCGASIPVCELAMEHTCAKCDRRQTWHPRTWRWFLDKAAEASDLPTGSTRTFAVDTGGRDQFIGERSGANPVGPFAAIMTCGRGDARCPKCDHALDPKSPGGACAGCGAKIRVRDTQKATSWAPLYVARAVGEDVGARFYLWIDEIALEREREIEARWTVTGIGCVTSLVVLVALFFLIWWRIAFQAAWQAVLILIPVMFVLNTALRLAAPIFARRKQKKKDQAA